MLSPDEQLVADRKTLSERLVAGIAAGDEQVIEEFVAHYSKPLRFVILKRTGSGDGLEELVQDTLTVTIQQIQGGKLRTAENVFGYMRMIGIRAAINWVSKRSEDRRRVPMKLVSATVPDSGLSPEKHLQIKEQAGILRQALAFLTAHDREILTRFYLKGDTPEQIQAAMGLSETQFRLHKSRAKSRLTAKAHGIMAGQINPRQRLRDKLAA